MIQNDFTYIAPTQTVIDPIDPFNGYKKSTFFLQTISNTYLRVDFTTDFTSDNMNLISKRKFILCAEIRISFLGDKT